MRTILEIKNTLSNEEAISTSQLINVKGGCGNDDKRRQRPGGGTTTTSPSGYCDERGFEK